jgi:DnaJ-class molecular chaperone
VVKTKEHAVFNRRGADLLMKKEISLYEALTGVSLLIKHLDGRTLHVTSKPGEVLAHEALKQVAEEGMPIYGNSFMKGCLFIQFEIKFPTNLNLTDAQRGALAGILRAKAAPTIPSDVEEVTLEDVDLEARRARERLGEDAQGDEDEGGHPGMQQVQCAHQ